MMDDTTIKLLNLITDDARVERNLLHQELHHQDRAPLERKRTIAMVVTKLEEAQMWLQRYRSIPYVAENNDMVPEDSRRYR